MPWRDVLWRVRAAAAAATAAGGDGALCSRNAHVAAAVDGPRATEQATLPTKAHHHPCQDMSTFHQIPMHTIEEHGLFGVETTGSRVLRNECTIRDRVKRAENTGVQQGALLPISDFTISCILPRWRELGAA